MSRPQTARYRPLLVVRCLHDAVTGATLTVLVVLLTLRAGSPALVALEALAQGVPLLLLSRLAGRVVSTQNAARVMGWALLVRGGILLVLALSLQSVPAILALSALQAAVSAFFVPASQTIAMREPDESTRAFVAGWLQVVATLGTAVASAAAAGLVGSVGGAPVILAALAPVSWLTALVTRRLVSLAAPGSDAIPDAGTPPTRLPRPATTLIASAAGAAACFGVVTVAVPALVLVEHSVDVFWYGLVQASFVVPALVGGLVVHRFVRVLGAQQLFTVSLLIFGLGTSAMALAPDLRLLMLGQALAGAAQPLFGSGLVLQLRALCAPSLLGRVYSANFAGCQIAHVVGVTSVALLASAVSPPVLVGAAASGLLLVGLVRAASTRGTPPSVTAVGSSARSGSPT